MLVHCRSVLDTRFKALESATISSFRVSCSSSMFLPVKLGPRHVPVDQIRRNMMVSMTMTCRIRQLCYGCWIDILHDHIAVRNHQLD